MKILTSTNDLTISMNMEQDFKTDLGWEEGALQMEEQILSEIINPIENYETVRYIHKPYIVTGNTYPPNFTQTDIWFQFYFLTGSTYVNDYEPTGLSNRENALMLKQTVKSFFRLEFFKTPNGVKPDRTNRKLVFAKNLSLPLGEKYFHTDFNDFIFFPLFTGSNYRNKENMYLFWFQDESPFSGTTITGNTFWMTAKFYNAEDGSISDFVNKPNFTDTFSDGRIGTGVTKSVIFYEKKSTDSITEYEDLYYKVTIDKNDYSYIIERDVQNDVVITATPTPTPMGPTPTPTTGGATNTPTPTPSNGPTSYDCIDGVCTLVQGLNGVYSDLNDCQQNCSPITTPTPTSVTSTPTPIVIQALANGSMEPCVGGSINDFMGANVFLTSPVSVETIFNVTVYYQSIGANCSSPNMTINALSQSFQITVLAGESTGSVNACSNGYYISSGANICGACVNSSNNTVDTITFVNPVGC